MIETYTYIITNTDPTIGAMEVLFSAPGMPDALVGARMPYEGESLDAVVASFAPFAYWDSIGKVFADVTVGHSASITPVVSATPSPLDQPTVQAFTEGQTALTAARTTPLQFLSLFTQAEQLTITSASLQEPQIRLWYDQLIAANEVVNTDPRISAGLDALVAFGLLSQTRRDTILPPTAGVTPL